MGEYRRELAVTLDEYNESETIRLYTEFRDEIGLLEIEKYLLQKYASYGDDLLEIGCGTGRATFGTYELGFHNLHAFDICSAMVEKCWEENKLKQYKISFEICDALEFSGQTYDVIVFWFNGLMVIPGKFNRKKCVSNVAKHLKKGGFFMFTTPSCPVDYNWNTEKRLAIDSGYITLPEYGDRVYDEKYYIHFPSEGEISDLFSMDFKIVETGICDECVCQTGRGKSLTLNEHYWVVKRI